MDIAVLAGVLCNGVRGSPALCATVPGDPEEQQQRRLLHQSVSGAAHSQHPAHLLLVRKTRRGMCFDMIMSLCLSWILFHLLSSFLLLLPFGRHRPSYEVILKTSHDVRN